MGESENEKLLKSLRTLIQKRDVEKIKFLLNNPQFDVNVRDVTHDLQTPLMCLCYSELHDKYLLEIIDIMLDRNVDLNLQDSLGRTAVMHACIARRTTVADYLISDPTTRLEIFDFDGNSALTHAVKSIDCIITKRILEHPAGISLLEIYNSNGQKPLHISIKAGNKKLIKLIEHYEAKIPKVKVKEKQLKLEHDPINSIYSPRTKKKMVKRKSDSSLSIKLKADDTDSEDGRSSAEIMNQNRSKKSSSTVFSPELILPSISEKLEKKQSLNQPSSSRRKARRNSVSLPDLRDTPNCLINSGDNTPTYLDGAYDSDDNEYTDATVTYPSPRKLPDSISTVRKCNSEQHLTFPSIATKGSKPKSQVKRTLTESSIFSNSDDALTRTIQRLL